MNYNTAIALIARRESRRRRYSEGHLPVVTIRNDAVHLVGLGRSLARPVYVSYYFNSPFAYARDSNSQVRFGM